MSDQTVAPRRVTVFQDTEHQQEGFQGWFHGFANEDAQMADGRWVRVHNMLVERDDRTIAYVAPHMARFNDGPEPARRRLEKN